MSNKHANISTSKKYTRTLYCVCIFPQQNDFQNDCLNINKGSPALPQKMSLMSEWNSGSNLVTAKLITFIQRSNLRIKFSMESVESLRIANPCALKELGLWRRTMWVYCFTEPFYFWLKIFFYSFRYGFSENFLGYLICALFKTEMMIMTYTK